VAKNWFGCLTSHHTTVKVVGVFVHVFRAPYRLQDKEIVIIQEYGKNQQDKLDILFK
jgi:hypothetical protein